MELCEAELADWRKQKIYLKRSWMAWFWAASNCGSKLISCKIVFIRFSIVDGEILIGVWEETREWLGEERLPWDKIKSEDVKEELANCKDGEKTANWEAWPPNEGEDGELNLEGLPDWDKGILFWIKLKLGELEVGGKLE